MIRAKEYNIPNTFGIPACARHYVEYASEVELQACLPLKGPVLHIGRGSNLLFDGDYEGTILHSAITDITDITDMTETSETAADETWLHVGSGMVFDDLVAYCIGKGLYGLENLSAIPGEVGASAVQNIGAYGVEACQCIRRVEGYMTETGIPFALDGEACHYGYRQSIFKDSLCGRVAITYVTFGLSRRFVPQTEYGGIRQAIEASGLDIHTLTAEALRDIIIDIRRQKLPDPAVQGNAGSFFMNPIVARSHYEDIRRKWPEVPHYDVDGGHVKIPAAWLIEQCGWKGRTMGRAAVHERQPLVLVNTGGATAREVLDLCKAVQKSVQERFGIRLQTEVNIITSTLPQP
ncbi:MAG: UDP-N-acetylmuramate dehydrogenase [Bacteroidaceae bacterium]|nr:UDP-N-acetylmuramate dehydrogenase [Bacteroidaceae bacterium]